MARAHWSLFGLTRDPEKPVIRLPMSQELQREVTALFLKQHADFLPGKDLEEVEFDVRLTPDESEIFVISRFELPLEVLRAIKDPVSVDSPPVDEDLLASIKGLFLGHSSTPEALFQVFDSRRVLSSRGFSILFSGGVLRRLQDPGLTLDTQLAASFSGTRLHFRSYYVARRLFDLSSYFREATDEQLDIFSQHRSLRTDRGQLDVNADSWVRKKVALILQGGILETKPVREIAEIASNYGLTLQVVQEDEGERLVLPEEKKTLKDFLRLLEEDFFTSVLTATKFLSNSKRQLRV